MAKDKDDDVLCCDHPAHADNGRGEIVCRNCGLVINIAFVNQKPRTFTDGDSKKNQNERRSSPYGCRTVIPVLRQSAKLQRTNSVLTAEEKNLSVALPKFKAMSERLGIPDHIISTAWKIYRECQRRKFLVGRSIEEFIVISVYLGSRVSGFPLLLSDILGEFDFDAKGINRIAMNVIRNILPLVNMKFKPINIAEFLKRFGMKIGLQPMEIKRAVQISTLLDKKMLGKDPKGVCAAIIYLIGGRTQTEIAKGCGVTEVTLRTRASEIKGIIAKMKGEKHA